MANQMNRSSTVGLLLTCIVLQGCANAVGDIQSEIVNGVPVSERSESRYSLVVSDQADDSLSPHPTAITDSTLAVSAVIIEPITVTTARHQRSSQEVIPYSGVTELADWPLSLLVGWIELLEGRRSFVSYIDGLNPFMNSERFTARREIQTLSQTPLEPKVEERHHVRRVEGAQIALAFPGLPPVEFRSEEQSASRITLGQLLTHRLSSAPRAIEGQVTFRESPEPVEARFELAPEVSKQVFHASSRIARMDPTDPDDVAAVVFTLRESGFGERARKIERDGIARHGASTLGRSVADIHINTARTFYQREETEAALASIELARAKVETEPEAWDLLEADVHESAGLKALDDMEYDRARSNLLKASRLDHTRQARLAGFVSMSLEAMDRETDRETRVSNSVPSSATSYSNMPAAMPLEADDPNVFEECLAREAALQACRLVPGFGKDICKSGVRTKYAGVTCP